MKICMFTITHNPFDSRIYYKESLSLKKAGYDVTIIAPYNKKRDVVNELKIIGIEVVYRTKIIKFLTSLIKIYKLCKLEKADFYHFHDVELLPVGLLLRVFTRAKIIYDAHECFPDMIRMTPAISERLRNTIANLVSLLEKMLCPFMHYIIVADDALKKRYTKMNKNVEIIYNFLLLSMFKESGENSELINKYKKWEILIYEGGINKYRGLFQMMIAVREVKKSISNIKLLLLGKFTNLIFKKEAEEYIRKNNLRENIEYISAVDHKYVPQYIRLARIGLVILQPVSKFLKNIPIKQFEYMACGIPIVGSKLPPIQKYIEESYSGILVNPENVDEIADAIKYLLENPKKARMFGENGKKAVLEKYNWGLMEKRLLKIYDNMRPKRGMNA